MTLATSRSSKLIRSQNRHPDSFHALHLLHAEIDSLDIRFGGIMGPMLGVLPFPWLRISEGLRLHMFRRFRPMLDGSYTTWVLHSVACSQKIMHQDSSRQILQPRLSTHMIRDA